MIQRTAGLVFVGWLIAVACFTEAAADHLTGLYKMVSQDARTAHMAGSILRIQQNGRALQGQITGSKFTAQIQGETDGGNNARGFMTAQGGQRQYFEAAFDQSGAVRFSLIATDGQGRPDYNAAITLMFAREGSAPGAPPGYGPQPGYGGPPPGYGGQPGSGAPSGYGAQPGYPTQPGPGGPSGYGPPGTGQPGYGGAPPGYGPQPGSPYPPQQGAPPGQWPPR
jgi:hypothetical protein